MTAVVVGPRISNVGRRVRGWAPALVLSSLLMSLWQWSAKAGHLPISVPAPSAIWDEFFRKRDTDNGFELAFLFDELNDPAHAIFDVVDD